MPERLETTLELLMAFFMLVLFAFAFGHAIDNHAARLDPSTPYYTGARQ